MLQSINLDISQSHVKLSWLPFQLSHMVCPAFQMALFNQTRPETKESQKINLLKVPFLCFLHIEGTTRISQIRPKSD